MIGKADKESLRNVLQDIEARELRKLILHLANMKEGIFIDVLEWLHRSVSKETKLKRKGGVKTKQKATSTLVNDKLALEYWDHIEDLMYKLEGYHETWVEDELEGYLGRIEDLAKSSPMSRDTRLELMNKAMYLRGTLFGYGFEEAVMDSCYQMCKSQEDWMHLLERLKGVDEFGGFSEPTSTERQYIMEIIKEKLGDDEYFVSEQEENLETVEDYMRLVDYYEARENHEKSEKLANNGILNAKGNSSELYQFLLDFYSKNDDDENLKCLAKTAISRKHSERMVLNGLFEFHKEKDDYNTAKEYLLQAFEYMKSFDDFIGEYKRMKSFLVDADWAQVEPRFLEKCKKSRILHYMEICQENKAYEEILPILKSSLESTTTKEKWNEMPIQYERFARKLEKVFPDEIIDLYWSNAQIYILKGNRKAYKRAGVYLGYARKIFTSILKKGDEWSKRIKIMKNLNHRRTAFLEETKDLN